MRGKIMVVIGLTFMLIGLNWYAALLRESTQAANIVQELVPRLEQVIPVQYAQETEPDDSALVKESMTERQIDGIGYVGVLEIPVLNLELPVISSWSSENGKIAPCLYSGTVFGDDMILCAHNYDSHFGDLDELTEGDFVRFTDMDGNNYTYQVLSAQILAGTDVDTIQEGDWDLTLFTCTAGGKSRYIVRLGRLS